MSGKFMYFAYGSNLLAKRIHINNHSAVRAGIGKIQDYQLTFLTYSKRWRGASANIVTRPGSHVWGAIWEIDNEHMESLDRQEGVADNIYRVLHLDVIRPDGKVIKCRVYQQTSESPIIEKFEDLPNDRRPSAVYLNVILKGAIESGLPEDYQNDLKRISHNGYDGEVDSTLNLSLK